jgi:hypothetical protein
MEFFKYCTFENIAFFCLFIILTIFVSFVYVRFIWQDENPEIVEARKKARDAVKRAWDFLGSRKTDHYEEDDG